MNQTECVDALDSRSDGPDVIALTTTHATAFRHKKRPDSFSGGQRGISNGLDQFFRHVERSVQKAIEVRIEFACKLFKLFRNSDWMAHHCLVGGFQPRVRFMPLAQV